MIFGKVMWVGRATVFMVGLAVVLALTVGVVSKATAHTGSAGLFHLGHSNPVRAISTLAGSVASGVLNVSNTSTASTATAMGAANKSGVSPAVRATNSGGGPALGLNVASGKAPMTVSGGAAKVANLDADKLDGKEASDFYATGSKVADADTLDGMNSTQFIEGSGKVQSYAAAGGPGNYIWPYFEGGFFRVAYLCPSTLTNNGEVFFRNLAGEQINLFFDNGSTNPQYIQLANGETFQPSGTASGEFVTYQIHSPTHGVATISVMTVHRANDCHVQAQVVVDK